MENEQSASGKQDNSIMKSIEQRARSRGRSDLMTQRLKNRERQRRYRARKRLEADTKKPFVVQETPAVQVELQPSGNHNSFKAQPNENRNNFMTRIYCKRNWKKDARRAHLLKHQDANGSIDHSSTLTSVPEIACLAIGNKTESTLEREVHFGSSGVVNNETPTRGPLGRRDWKAEARRKKN
ncbi:hypothetical protein PIB30_082126 [Stylosanthes scabra]|uniref:Uncharacterized protein n=1 Tax=Stylosanthes scabra TaxID=79078 RepID=A0ABU6RRQ9_9FABA|nr:hypothetical protein [Stylosanthes scabra]